MEDYHIDVKQKEIRRARVFGKLMTWVVWVGLAVIYFQYFR